MKKTVILLAIAIGSYTAGAQGVGMNCQYFPGLQIGVVSIKATNHPKFTKNTFGAGAPLLMIDRVTNHWYTNMDFSALYYGATQTNKANDNRLKISKAEGGVFAGRLGYLWGDGDQFRMGGNLNFGFSTSNLDSAVKPFKDQIFNKRGYYNYGLGLIAYKKFGKFRAVGKIGYELYRRKGMITKANGLYFEGTLGYSFYQKYGISIMPCFYSKKFNYLPLNSTSATESTAKVKSFVLKMGITKFF